MFDRDILGSLYLNLIEEGIEEKIPKLLNFVPPNVENKEEYIRWAAETFDPTKNAEYITWILRMLKKRVLAGEEDGPKVKERLEQFTELKRKPQFPKDKRDINRFKTYGDLAETVDEFSGIQTKGEQVRAAREEGIEFIDQLGDTKLYLVTTAEAGAKYFRPTDWCVKDPRYFDNYGPPYYFFTDSNDQPETLMHLDSDQTMDIRDRPTDLNDEQKELMSSEKMTQYVIQNDNSDKALSTYYREVGPGYDDEVERIFIDQVKDAILEANKELTMFSISDFDVYSIEEDLDNWEPDAYGGFNYDFTPYEEYKDDKDFLEIITNILSRHFEIYVNSDYSYDYDDVISEDMKSYQIYWKYKQSHTETSIVDKVQSFYNELSQAENKFDLEEFDKYFKEELLDKGYISSGWADFTNRVDLDNLNLRHFRKDYGGEIIAPILISTNRPFDRAPSFELRDIDVILNKYKITDHPYVLLAKFVRPLVDNGVKVLVDNNARDIILEYTPKYKDDKHPKEYMKELKLVKALDKHYKFYANQIREFMINYVYPYLENFDKTKDYGIPENIKIPLLQIKGRKDSPDQMMLDLHENRFLAFLLKKGLKF